MKERILAQEFYANPYTEVEMKEETLSPESGRLLSPETETIGKELEEVNLKITNISDSVHTQRRMVTKVQKDTKEMKEAVVSYLYAFEDEIRRLKKTNFWLVLCLLAMGITVIRMYNG